MVEAVPGNAGRADYPRMLYHADGRHIVVQTPEQHQVKLNEGFSQFPHPVHQQTPIVKQPMVSDSITVLIRECLERVLDERGMTKVWADKIGNLASTVWPQASTNQYPQETDLPQVPLTQRSYTHGK